jgi:integrase
MAKSKTPMKGVYSITKKGVKYWYARIDGQRIYCGKDEKGLELAIAAKSKAIVKGYENKEIDAGLKVKKIGFKKFKDLSNWYMTLPSVQENKGYQRYVQAAVHLLKYFGERPIPFVSADEQERYREHRKTVEKAADKTINLEIGVLRAMFRLALKRKMIPVEVMPGEFIQTGGSVPRRIVTDDEFESLLNNADDDDFKDLITCAYESAMRSGEIRGLARDQIHLNVRHISGAVLDYIDLGIFDTKTGARRTVPVSPRLKEILERRIEGPGPEDPVFTFNGQKWYTNTLLKKLKDACEKAGIAYGDKTFDKKGNRVGIVFHCFRHSRTSKWVEMGFSDEIIRRATGHKSLAAYQTYVKLDPFAVMRLVDGPEETGRHKNDIKSL